MSLGPQVAGEKDQSTETSSRLRYIPPARRQYRNTIDKYEAGKESCIDTPAVVTTRHVIDDRSWAIAVRGGGGASHAERHRTQHRYINPRR